MLESLDWRNTSSLLPHSFWGLGSSDSIQTCHFKTYLWCSAPFLLWTRSLSKTHQSRGSQASIFSSGRSISELYGLNEIFILRTEHFNSTVVSSLSLLIISKSSSWARETSLGYSWDEVELSSHWKQVPLSTLRNFFKYLRLAILKSLFGFQSLWGRKRESRLTNRSFQRPLYY